MGFGDFLKGTVDAALPGKPGTAIGEAVEDIGGAARNVAKGVGFAATHLDDAARFAGRNISEVGKGLSYVATHPGVWDDVAKAYVKEEFTNPWNIATNVGLLGLTVATGGLGGAGLVGKAALAARGVDRAVEVGKIANTAADVSRGARVLQKVDRALEAPTRAAMGVRKAVTGSELGFVGGRRAAMAERFVGNVEDASWARKAAGRAIEGSKLAPTHSSLARNVWRAEKTMGRAESAAAAPGRAEQFSTGVQFAANPLGSLMNMDFGSETEAPKGTAEPAVLASTEFSPESNTGIAKRQVADWGDVTPASTGAVSTMPKAIGPRSWYNTGRGFQSNWDQQVAGV